MRIFPTRHPLALPHAKGGSLTSPRPSSPCAIHSIAEWIALFDCADHLMRGGDLHEPFPQLAARKALDLLVRYEHQMTAQARRRAREALWQRDHPADPLPGADADAHDAMDPCCHCARCRVEWEHCRCSHCRLLRVRAARREGLTESTFPARHRAIPINHTKRKEISRSSRSDPPTRPARVSRHSRHSVPQWSCSQDPLFP